MLDFRKQITNTYRERFNTLAKNYESKQDLKNT